MSDGHFSFETLELVESENQITVTDPDALGVIRGIIENSPRMTKRTDEIEFAEMKRLTLISTDPEQSRVYVIDLQNGYATIQSKGVMPVYKLSDLVIFNDVIESSGKPKPNGE